MHFPNVSGTNDVLLRQTSLSSCLTLIQMYCSVDSCLSLVVRNRDLELSPEAILQKVLE